MSHAFQIPDDLYAELATYAAQCGKTPENLLLSLLLEDMEQLKQGETPASLHAVRYNPVDDPLAPFIGTFDNGDEDTEQIEHHITSTPIFTTIEGSLPGGKRLTHPLVIQIEQDDGEVLVSEPHFYIHASAPTVSEAIAEFKRVLSDELEELTSDEERLAPRLQAQLQYLRTAIKAA